MDATQRLAFVRRLLAWGRANRRAFPWREERDPFRILVAEILLQRSRGKTVAKVYERLFERWPDAESLAGASEGEIRRMILPLGLTRRAVTLKALAAEVARAGGVPRSVEGLLALPGVGRYAAAATAAVAFARHGATVDGVTARVYRRYFGLPAEVPPSEDEQLWAVVRETTPRSAVREWNWAVLDLAATVCLPKIPRCEACPLVTRCVWATTSRVSVGGARLRSAGGITGV